MGPESRSQTRSVGQWWKWGRAMLAPPRLRMVVARRSAAWLLTRMWTSSTRGEVADDLGVDPGDGLELAGPVFGVVGPGDPGGGVGLPLGGHAKRGCGVL